MGRKTGLEQMKKGPAFVPVLEIAESVVEPHDFGVTVALSLLFR